MKEANIRNCCLAAALFALLLNSGSPAQEQISPAAKPARPTIELSLIVTDSTKKSLNSVRKEDIRVIDDKVEQKVLDVQPDERLIDCGIAIDSSGSLRQLLPSALEAAKTIILNKRPSEEYFIESFVDSEHISNVREFTSDTDALVDALKLIYIQRGQTALLDAVYLGAEYVGKYSKTPAGRRKVLILISDGEDRNSFYNLDAVVKHLHKNGVQVFAIGLTTELDKESGLIEQSPREKSEKLLKTITEQTGGRVFFPATVGELRDAVTQIVLDLRGQFRITYQLDKEVTKEGIRKVEMKFISGTGEKRTAISPRAYYVNPK
jgi:Ca-activated chloride channel family protein